MKGKQFLRQLVFGDDYPRGFPSWTGEYAWRAILRFRAANSRQPLGESVGFFIRGSVLARNGIVSTSRRTCPLNTNHERSAGVVRHPVNDQIPTVFIIPVSKYLLPGMAGRTILLK